MNNFEFTTINPYIQVGWGFNVGCKDYTMNASNVVNVDKDNPRANVVTDFREGQLEGYANSLGGADFVIFNRSLCDTECWVQYIRRAWELMKPGGRLIITEQFKKEDKRHHWIPPELEGHMALFKRRFFKETIVGDKESYIIIYQKRRTQCSKNISTKQEKK